MKIHYTNDGMQFTVTSAKPVKDFHQRRDSALKFDLQQRKWVYTSSIVINFVDGSMATVTGVDMTIVE